jgi:class 3 adenylate cyclase
MEIPETRFAWNGDVSLAYQVMGDGPVDLLYLPGWASNVDVNWESQHLARFLRGLASKARLIVTDRRGWGCSDRFSPTDVPPIETLTEDLLVVMDAAGSERAAILATMEGAVVACLFAATYPDRLSALILCDVLVVYEATDDMPWLPDADRWEEIAENIRLHWGSREYFPEPQMDEREREWFARLQRSSFARGAFISELRRYRETDIRSVLPSIHTPTLILSDADGTVEFGPDNGRYVAARIPGARSVEYRNEDRFWWYRPGADAIVDEVGRFLAVLKEEEASFDRVLATVMFTDIVDSTQTAAELGDRAWRELLERHHATVRSMLTRYGGAEVDTAGDGFFATFDGPARGVRCGQAIVEAVRPLGIEVRAGVHTGEVETIAGKVGGLAVVIGARVGALAGANEILATSTVRDLTAGSGLSFSSIGEHELKGVPDRWHLYLVADERA